MKRSLLIVTLGLSVSLAATAQSGRRKPPAPVPSPPAVPEEKPAEPVSKTADTKASTVTAEKGEDYRCTDDGTLAHLVNDGVNTGLQAKEVSTRAEILARPEPKYTEEARRRGVQGVVILKLLLGADGKIDRIRVARVLPFGLTESAIRAACTVKFKPAIKEGVAVDQWVDMEYGFSLVKSSIYGP
jgi:periplasmic protein TonB